MTTTRNDLDEQIAEAEALREELNVQFGDILGRLNEVNALLTQLTARKTVLDGTDFRIDQDAFKDLCENARKNQEPLFRKKMEEVIRSFPLPAGMRIRNITMAPLSSQPNLTFEFDKDVVFSDADAEMVAELVEFVDLADGFHEHTPLMIHERYLAAHGTYTIVIDRDNEHARLYRQFFHQTTVIEDGSIAEVLTEVSAEHYGSFAMNTDPVDWDSEEPDGRDY